MGLNILLKKSFIILKHVREIKKGYLGNCLKFWPTESYSLVRVSVMKWMVFLLEGWMVD